MERVQHACPHHYTRVRTSVWAAPDHSAVRDGARQLMSQGQAVPPLELNRPEY